MKGFSSKRALGISGAKSRIARSTGIPTTKQGRQRKLEHAATGGGCLIPTLMIILILLSPLVVFALAK